MCVCALALRMVGMEYITDCVRVLIYKAHGDERSRELNYMQNTFFGRVDSGKAPIKSEGTRILRKER